MLLMTQLRHIRPDQTVSMVHTIADGCFGSAELKVPIEASYLDNCDNRDFGQHWN